MYDIDVSVVIPCFNSAATVERAVESVLVQTMQPREIIIIDDCSVDNSVDIIKRIEGKCNAGFIKILMHAGNKGPSDARNTGWKIAVGKYIAFLDSDDTWLPLKLEIQYQIMIQEPKIVISGHSRIYDGDKAVPSKPDFQFNVISKREILASNVFETTSTIMVLREIDSRFPSGKYFSEEYYLVCNLILRGFQAVKIQSVLAVQYKKPFGDDGLSKSLIRMEKGELETYKMLFSGRLISFAVFLYCSVLSIVKFFKRLLVFCCR